MNFMKNVFVKNKGPAQSLLMRSVHLHENSPVDPFELARQSIAELKRQASDEDEYLQYLLEDIIYTSIYATFYEELMVTLKEHFQLARPLVEKFQEESHKRDAMIGSIAEAHVNYILQDGHCVGCAHCDNHADVAELLGPWQRVDTPFFEDLYLKMQAIQTIMEQVVFDDIFEMGERLTSEMSRENILKLRQYIAALEV